MVFVFIECVDYSKNSNPNDLYLHLNVVALILE